ncbi:MAG: ABC transporter permease [Synergistaceae bacterium]|nr:ABC transporter permease [Synergistaceae bacterium]
MENEGRAKAVSVAANPLSNAKDLLRRAVTSSLFVVVCLLFAVWTVGALIAPAMLQKENLINVFRNSAITGTFALAATCVLLVGEIDLSLGPTMVFALIMGSTLYETTSDVIMIFAMLLSGALLGLFNGVIVAVFKVKSLMATLGTFSLYGGLAYLLSSGKVVLFYQAPRFLWLGRGMVGSVPVPVIFALAVLAVMYVVLQFTKFGREVYFTGANPLAAWLSGVNVRRIKLLMFVVSGFVSSLAGVFQAALFNELGPSYVSGGYEMTGLSIAIFGGVSMAGGKGSVLSTAVASLTFQLLLNILTLTGMGTYMEQVFKGIFLIVVVISFQRLEVKRYSKLGAAA